jgi:hypothetical protein
MAVMNKSAAVCLAPVLVALSCSNAFAQESTPYYTLPYPIDVDCIADNLSDIYINSPVTVFVDTITDEGHLFSVQGFDSTYSNIAISSTVMSYDGTVRVETLFHTPIDRGTATNAWRHMEHTSVMTDLGTFEYQGLSILTEEGFNLTGEQLHHEVVEAVDLCIQRLMM